MRKSITITARLLTALFIAFSASAFAQTEEKMVEKDTMKIKFKDLDNKLGKDDADDEVKYPRIYGGLTFSRIDWGFSRIIEDGSFTLSDENKFLAYKKASNFGFDVAQVGVRFNDKFKIYLSTGFEWNYLRLKENVLLAENTTPLTYAIVDPSEVNYSKNVLTTTYLRVPLTFELRSRKLRNGDRLKFAFGPMTGILLKATQRLKSDELGKQKFKDNYNFASFQYGGFARVGFGGVGLFAKYYANDLFEKSPTQEGLNNFAFGLTLGF